MAAAARMHDLAKLPTELLLQILWFLDVPELLLVSRTSHRLRSLALDPLLHIRRLRCSSLLLSHSLPHRPLLQSLQPPSSAIYLTRTHLAARRLHWSLNCIRLNRLLSRRPALATLVSANIVPRECCRRDRSSGQMMVGAGGGLVERKRKVEREKVKEGLRVWLERKAGEIRRRKKDGVAVGVLVWRFSRRPKLDAAANSGAGKVRETDRLQDGKVLGLKRFWEGLGSGSSAARVGA